MEPVAVLSTSTNDLNLMRAVTESQCGEMKQCDMGCFGLNDYKTCCCILNYLRGLIAHDGSPARSALQ